MIKIWALESLDGSVTLTSDSKEQLEAYVANTPLASMCTIVEMDYNDDPITERGERIQEELRELMKDVVNFRMDKQRGFYEMHIDDRLQLIYDILTDTKAERVENVDEWTAE